MNPSEGPGNCEICGSPASLFPGNLRNGPGIPAHELRRVTERGFTGSAGRARGESTGMGLYIVSKLCEALNISLEISSEEGRFTRFSFRFPN